MCEAAVQRTLVGYKTKENMVFSCFMVSFYLEKGRKKEKEEIKGKKGPLTLPF